MSIEPAGLPEGVDDKKDELIKAIIDRFAGSESRINELLNYLYGIHKGNEIFKQTLSDEDINFISNVIDTAEEGFLQTLMNAVHKINDDMTASRHTANMLNDAYSLKLAMTFLEVPEVRYALTQFGNLTPTEVQQLRQYVNDESGRLKDLLIEAINQKLRLVIEDSGSEPS